MFQICGDVKAVGFPVQNVYKMTYGDENATFEPVNGYDNLYGNPNQRTISADLPKIILGTSIFCNPLSHGYCRQFWSWHG